jgi:hypothetical protein
MNMQEIRGLAKDFGIKISHLNKTKLIQAIQLEEGNFGCFSSATIGECDQFECTWRDDCFRAAKKVSH